MLKQNIMTSTLVSTSIVMLSMLFTPEPGTTTVVHSDDNHQSVTTTQVDSHPKNPDIRHHNAGTKQLADQVETLLSKQQALVNKNFILEQRITELEASTQHTMQTSLDNGSTGSYIMSPEEVEQDEQMMAIESEQLALEFDNLTAELQNEDHDANWSAMMDTSFAEIEQRLQALNMNSVSISQKQCGSESCLVEYTVNNENQDQPTVMDDLLAAQGASEVVVKHVEENGSYRILALYKR